MGEIKVDRRAVSKAERWVVEMVLLSAAATVAKRAEKKDVLTDD